MDNGDIPKFSIDIDAVIGIPSELREEYNIRQSRALVGSLETIQRRFYEMPIAIGWAQYSKALKESGAIASPRYKMPMVNTDVIPQELAPFVLIHEVVESTLDSDPSENHDRIAAHILKELNLFSAISHVRRPRLNHSVAVIHQLRMAQRAGMLDQMMRFADELEMRDENRMVGSGNREFRYAVSEMLQERYPIVENLESSSHS